MVSVQHWKKNPVIQIEAQISDLVGIGSEGTACYWKGKIAVNPLSQFSEIMEVIYSNEEQMTSKSSSGISLKKKVHKSNLSLLTSCECKNI